MGANLAYAVPPVSYTHLLTHGILVRYADDTVIICKNKKSAKHALNLLRYIMGKLDLKLHPEKTKIVSMWDGKEGFDFLGMHHKRMTTETSKDVENNYRLCRYSLSRNEVEVLTEERIDCFNVGYGYVY